MPEINDNERGWVIDVPKNRMGEAIYTTQADRDAISLSIRQGLERALHEIVANRAIVSRKADNAIASIAEQHDPARYAAKLEQIYVEAVADRS
jgi:hypothetical protein